MGPAEPIPMPSTTSGRSRIASSMSWRSACQGTSDAPDAAGGVGTTRCPRTAPWPSIQAAESFVPPTSIANASACTDPVTLIMVPDPGTSPGPGWGRWGMSA